MSANLLQMIRGSKSFGMRILFHGASFAINEGEHIGVIGPNGAGKTTLFRILIDQEQLTSGEITRAGGLRVGYLAQEDDSRLQKTVEETLSSGLTPIWELKAMAQAFGLLETQFEQKLASLSGGYRMRVKLLALLGEQPDLMLLDEPTNYLDLETLLVLEEFLIRSRCAFLLISHDREFLRRTTDHILEVEGGDVTKFNGNIDDYFEQKEMLREQLEKRAMSLEAKRNEILDFAARFGAKATKARQVQSRLKSLGKMESIEIKSLPLKTQIRLPEPPRIGRSVLKMTDVDFGYGEKMILSQVNLEVLNHDHIGVVGMNGAGKTTFLKGLAGELAPLKGERTLGYQAEIAYFAQHVSERLDPDDTVIEAMSRLAHPDTARQQILDLAGSLLFSGDDTLKKVRLLSGGEKSRVALGQMLLKRASCLLLDEPTNHLDFHTVEALTQALANYKGTVIIVSHDRGFVRRTATKILEIRSGKVELYPGNYDEYVWSVEKGALSNRAEIEISQIDSGSGAGKSENKFNYKEKKKSLEREFKLLEKELLRIEADLETNLKKITELGERLLTLNGLEANQCAKEQGLLQKDSDELEVKWLELGSRKEALMCEIAAL